MLTALTQLEHLQLPPCEDSVTAVPADFAAATASPQLTHLNIATFAGPDRAVDIFPAHRRLPSLLSLRVEVF